MRSFIIALFYFGLVSCNSAGKTNPETSAAATKEVATPDFSVALTFINDYTKLCTQPQRTKTSDWIRQNPLLSDTFKNRYTSLLDSAEKKDPELGLDFDPIFDAQDFPEKGFSLVRIDTVNRYVTVAGNDWKEFELVLKVGQENNKWLVDGAGVINIPVDKRAKR